jgi:cysteine synthase B
VTLFVSQIGKLLIGNTPIVSIRNFNNSNSKHFELFAKLEYCNPFGSVKDRAAYWMLKKAQEEGRIRKNKSIIIEPTSGNTGIALSAMAKYMGYKAEVVIPQAASAETKQTLRAYGAEVLETSEGLCPRVGSGTDQSIALAQAILKRSPDKYFLLNQYENEANFLAHYQSTGPEIWRQTNGKITHFFTGVGTGGTLIGVGLYLKQQNSRVKIFAVTPKDIQHRIQGLRNFKVSRKPKILEEGLRKAAENGVILVDEWVEVSDDDAFATVKKLFEDENLFVGPSSGAVAHAAFQTAQKERGVGVMIFADDGSKYKSVYAEKNLFNNGITSKI